MLLQTIFINKQKLQIQLVETTPLNVNLITIGI